MSEIGYKVYKWLREAEWPGLRVSDALAWIGITPSPISIEGWSGVSEIINAIIFWIFELSLPVGCLLMGFIFLVIALFVVNLDIPKTEEWRET